MRSVGTSGASAWSRPFGFDMRWEDLPVPMLSRPGLVRWTPVQGATAYDVWYPDIGKQLRTHTNVADQREFYVFWRGSTRTFATTSVLKLAPGLWYYRVRGLNAAQVGTPAMSWSAPVAVRVVRPTFTVSGG